MGSILSSTSAKAMRGEVALDWTVWQEAKHAWSKYVFYQTRDVQSYSPYRRRTPGIKTTEYWSIYQQLSHPRWKGVFHSTCIDQMFQSITKIEKQIVLTARATNALVSFDIFRHGTVDSTVSSLLCLSSTSMWVFLSTARH